MQLIVLVEKAIAAKHQNYQTNTNNCDAFAYDTEDLEAMMLNNAPTSKDRKLVDTLQTN